MLPRSLVGTGDDWDEFESRIVGVGVPNQEREGKRPEMPSGGSPFVKAPTEKEKVEQESML